MERSYRFTSKKEQEDFVKKLIKYFVNGEGVVTRHERIIKILNHDVAKGTAALCVTKGSLLEVVYWEHPRGKGRFWVEIET